MRKYLVTQCCKCSYTAPTTEENKNKINAYKFSRSLAVGTYSESEFLSIVGDEFFKSGKFRKFVDAGWIKVIEEKDVTQKAIEHFNKL